MSAAEQSRPPSLREVQKNETRARVVEAARALFKERGYEAATIRDIARRAGVAPGSVFTTFESKAELLQEIIFSRYEEMLGSVRAAAAPGRSALDRMAAGLTTAYEVESRELRLLAETLGASWTWSLHEDRENRRRLFPLVKIMLDILADGQRAGEIRADVDLEILCDMIFSCYLRNFRRLLFDEVGVGELAGLMKRQLTLLFEGAAPR